MSQVAQRKAYREKLRAMGRCVDCAKRMAGKGRRYCDECLARTSRAARALRKARRASGLCHCGAAQRDGFADCESCAETARSGRKLLHTKRSDMGLCHCGAHKKPSRAGCGKCLERVRLSAAKLRAARLAVGQCAKSADCPGQVVAWGMCDMHHQYTKEYNRKYSQERRRNAKE
jgi:hypothetical protein